MSTIDQCPSSKKQGLPADKGAESLQRSAATGRTYWRSLDELAESKEFKDFLEREFPAHASELLEGSRRTFLKIMGASFALAGAAMVPGCRRPDHKIITYHRKPEEIIPGKPLFYASVRPIPGGGAEGLLVETHMGRPTKLEGNPLHPYNNGALTMQSQASVLGLYDPDRTPEIIKAMALERAADDRGVPFEVTSWPAFTADAEPLFTNMSGDGAGLVFLVEKLTSPARDEVRDRVMTRFPNAEWLPYSVGDQVEREEGLRIAFGAPMAVDHKLQNAEVVVAIDADPLGRDSTLPGLRGWAKQRLREGEGQDAARSTEMSRLYVAEPSMTLTGGQADHRVTARVDEASAIAVAIAERVLGTVGGSNASALRDALTAARSALDLSGVEHGSVFAKYAAGDLLRNRGRGVLMAGGAQPREVHALVAAVNEALQNVGATVVYRPLPGDAAASSLASIRRLSERLDAGDVNTVVVIGENPAFNAPADLEIARKLAAFKDAGNTLIHLGDADETAELATHHLGRAHWLEAWHDAVTLDGTYGVQQPMIKPLHDYRSDLELLLFIAGDAQPDAYGLVRDTMAKRFGMRNAEADPTRFSNIWKQVLHDGLATQTIGANAPASPRMRWGAVAEGVAGWLSRPAATAGVDVVFWPDEQIASGEMANNGWLQEQPDTVTKVAWSNPAMVSYETAKKLGLRTGRKLREPQYNHTDVARIVVDGREIEIPIWVQPGCAEDTIVLRMGNGRRVVGRVGDGAGYDVFPIRHSESMTVARGARVERANKPPQLQANTQDHWSMEGREFLREVDLPAWRDFGDELYYEWTGDAKVFPNIGEKKAKKILKDSYGLKRELTFAGRFGMEAHSPALLTSYQRFQDHYYTEMVRDPETGELLLTENGEALVQRDEKGRPVGKLNAHGAHVPQWGMTVDMNKCTGCGACAVACQAENNIPIVGQKEVAKGREMSWIRIDRYYGTDRFSPSVGVDVRNPDMFTMPVMCVHCENAPCEVVCPVNATVHGDMGTNNMAYNRCIGTRYCGNNCPYKVRRFNMFDYATKQFEGGLGQMADPADGSVLEEAMPSNENLVPPRLRRERYEVSNMVFNPNVTVRSRGVMEKCTYCIQRVNEARVEAKIHDLDRIPDGFFETACEQACPTDAIVFGDIYDYVSNDGKGSRVYRSRKTQRAYALLAYLNTRPRTLHLMRIRNPNESYLREIGREDRVESWKHPFHEPIEHDGTILETEELESELGGALSMRLPVLNNRGAHS